MGKEKLVRDPVNTFIDRDELHEAYKKKLRGILIHFALALEEFEKDASTDRSTTLYEFVDAYIEYTIQKEG